jgi:hypothetical protein
MDSSGYGEATRNFLMAFKEVEANLMAQKVSYTGTSHYTTPATHLCEEYALKKVDYKIKILHVTPDNYKAYIEPGKYNIGHLFWETSKLPRAWVLACNQLQEIWTGTRYGAEVIKNSGVTVPITVIPEAVDTNDPPDVRPYVLPNFKGVVFYSIFEWTERKNPEKLLHTFWKTFKGKTDVCLLLKVHKLGTDRGLRDILLESRGWKNSFVWKDTPRVFVYTDILGTEEMHRFHKTGDIFVSAHRGEGWGLPQCEAAMHLKPIISVGYGGIHEYFRRKDYLPVDFTLVPIDKTYNKYYEVGMEWAEADEASLSAQMQKAYDYKTSTNKVGLLAKYGYGGRDVVRDTCSYEKVGRKMLDRISQISLEKGWNE